MSRKSKVAEERRQREKFSAGAIAFAFEMEKIPLKI